MTPDTRKGLLLAAASGLAAAAILIAARPAEGATAVEARGHLAAPGLQAKAASIRRYLRRVGFPVYERPVYIANTPLGGTPYYPGAVVDAEATPDGPLLDPTLLTWNNWADEPALVEVLIHEYLHGLRDTTEYATLTPAERTVEEGLATAVAADLLPRYYLAVRNDDTLVGGRVLYSQSQGGYSRYAAMVVGVSKRATRTTNPDGPKARSWRYRAMRADRTERAAMWAAATGGNR